MPLVAATIVPHGWDLIPVLDENAGGAVETQRAMMQVGVQFAEAGVETVVLAGPHGIRVEGAICLGNVGRGAGTLERNGHTAEMNVPYDRPLALEIAGACDAAGVPTALAGYAGNRPDQSATPLDWGAMVPLWFLGHDDNRAGSGTVLSPTPQDDHGPAIVLVTPSRALPRQAMVDFGRVLGEVFANTDKKIGFVASCDWGHAHKETGPYGFHPAAKLVDDQVVAAIAANDLLSLIALPDEDVQNAAIDGLWQVLMLAGIQQVTPLDISFKSYEHPDYFGMIVASCTPAGA
ncbi:MAG: aromatic ring-opening dioxygenase subunit LigB [Thermomicrobiales bacterium]